MSEDSQPKSFTEDFEKLFDLFKEGTSYILHIYLYFMSKTFPVEFIENLFEHHKKDSSYDYSKEGKTFIYRFFNALFEVEKHIVAWSLQYAYSYLPLPFIKTIYDNFCVNNNLECTDVKLKKCKKALINSSKDSTATEKKPKGRNDLVSRPHPFIPQIPNSDNETVSSNMDISSQPRYAKLIGGKSETHIPLTLVKILSPKNSSSSSSKFKDATLLSSPTKNFSRNPFSPNERLVDKKEDTSSDRYGSRSKNKQNSRHLETDNLTNLPIISDRKVSLNPVDYSRNIIEPDLKSIFLKNYVRSSGENDSNITEGGENGIGSSSIGSQEERLTPSTKPIELIPIARGSKIEVKNQSTPVPLDPLRNNNSPSLRDTANKSVSNNEKPSKIPKITLPASGYDSSESMPTISSLLFPLVKPKLESSEQDSSTPTSTTNISKPSGLTEEYDSTRNSNPFVANTKQKNLFTNILLPNSSEPSTPESNSTFNTLSLSGNPTKIPTIQDFPKLIEHSSKSSAPPNQITPINKKLPNSNLPPDSFDVNNPKTAIMKQESFFNKLLAPISFGEQPSVSSTLKIPSPLVKPVLLKPESSETMTNSSQIAELSSEASPIDVLHAKTDPVGDSTNILSPPAASIGEKKAFTNSSPSKTPDEKLSILPKFDISSHLVIPEKVTQSQDSSKLNKALSARIPTVEVKNANPKPSGDFQNFSKKASVSSKEKNVFTNLSSPNNVEYPPVDLRIYSKPGEPQEESSELDFSKSSTNTSQSSAPLPKNPSMGEKVVGPDLLGDLSGTSNPSATSMKQENLFSNLSILSPSTETPSVSLSPDKLLPEKPQKELVITNPIAGLVKIFNPPPSMESISKPNLFSHTATLVDDSTPNAKQSSPFHFPSMTPSFPTVPHSTQAAGSYTEKKSGESVAPVSKNIPPTVDLGSALGQQIEQNNKAIQKNLDDFGKSIANVFSGGSAPIPGSG